MKNYIENNLTKMIDDLSKLVSYRSVYEEDELPFGKQNRMVIDEAIDMMNKKGFKTENVDYYACFGEIGEGDKVIGILAHLDVVSEGNLNNWHSDPFKLTNNGEKLFARGVCDDKGAAVASMWAMKYLLDTGYVFKKRVRLILGCNEENNSACMKYYVKKKGHVDMGFTPDGDFPGICGEKGIIFTHLESRNSKIIDIKGGEALNIVCPKVDITLSNNSFKIDVFKEYLDKNNIRYEINIDVNTHIVVYGKAGHSASPYTGINALSYLLEGLYLANFNDVYTNYFHKYFGLKGYGENLGFKQCDDQMFKTSAVPCMIEKNGDVIKTAIDIRYPTDTSYEDCKEVLDKAKDDNNEFIIDKNSDSLSFDPNNVMVKTLLQAYQDVTGDFKNKMKTIAGSTYAKTMNNIIAFGCQFPDEENQIHQDNEWLTIRSFKKQVEIYITAIKYLNEL